MYSHQNHSIADQKIKKMFGWLVPQVGLTTLVEFWSTHNSPAELTIHHVPRDTEPLRINYTV